MPNDAILNALKAVVAVQDEYDSLADDGSADTYAALEDFTAAAEQARAALKALSEEPDKLESARRQGQAQFDSVKEMVEELRKHDSCSTDWDNAESAIHDDALSVQVRSGWYTPGDTRTKDDTPAEYEILLCTGGPACRIIGELDNYGEPKTAELQVQDWFTPWTAIRPQVAPDNFDSEPILLEYARCFYFGEG